MLGTAVVVVVLAAAGCGGGGGDEAASPSTTTEPSPTSEPTSPSTTLTDEEAVLAAYQGYWDTWLAANDPPNPDHPDLERYATGAALAKVRESIANHRSVGQVVKLPTPSVSAHHPVIESFKPGEAVVLDCQVDDSRLIDAASGLVLNDEVGTVETRAVVVLEAGRWRVSSAEIRAQSTGVSGCAA